MLRALEVGLITGDHEPLDASEDVATVAAWLEGELWRPTLEAKTAGFRRAVAMAAAGVLAFGVAFVTLAGNQPHRAIAAVALGVGLILVGLGVGRYRSAAQLEPERRVESVSRVYWAALALPLDGHTAVYDLAGLHPRRRISLSILNRPERLGAIAARLEQLLGELRVLEPPEEATTVAGEPLWGHDGRITDTLCGLQAALGDVKGLQVESTALAAADPGVAVLKALAPRMRLVDAGPVLTEGLPPMGAVNDRIGGVYARANDAGQADVDDVLASIEASVDLLTARREGARRASLDLVCRARALASRTTAWPALAIYCPFCNQLREGQAPTLARATRLKEQEDGSWFCPVCASFVPVEAAITLSRFRDEAFYPVFDQMRLAAREEILRIDRDVEDQLVQLDKEQRVKLHEMTIEQEQERRKRLAHIRQFRSQAMALKTQVMGMAEAMTRYQKITADRRAQYEQDCRNIEGQVAERTQQALGRLEREFQDRQGWALAESGRKAEINRVEEERRHQETLGAAETTSRILLMTPKEREAMRPGLLDPINPFKALRRMSARGNSAKASANVRG